ncbi:MAG: hypothetical protein M3R25_09590 [Bacteroidota bacterium]|nr:hypothetical protein [Bacteroidota bacterium]
MTLKKYEGLINRMCKELAKLYISKEEARAVATRAGLEVSEIFFSDKSIDTWRSIVIYSITNNQLLSLVETCQKEHNTSTVLLEAVNQFYEQEMESADAVHQAAPNENELLSQLLEYLEAALIGFNAQLYNRNDLYERIRNRLKIEESMPYETFFAAHYQDMNKYERQLHKAIRNHTEYIKANHEKSLKIISQLKLLEKKIPKLTALRRHLDLWLHKFQTLFLPDPAMCILYTGVVEKYPFPKGVEDEIRKYLNQ